MQSPKARRAEALEAIYRRREEELAKKTQGIPVRQRRLPNTTQAKHDAAKPTREELDQPDRAIRALKMALIEYQREHLANIKTLEMIQESLAGALGRLTPDFEHARGGAIRTHARQISAAITNLVAKMRTAENKRKAYLNSGPKAAGDKRTRYGENSRLKIETALNKLYKEVPDAKSWKPAKLARVMNKKGGRYRSGKKVGDPHLAKTIRDILKRRSAGSTVD